jgi:hypothetical protein
LPLREKKQIEAFFSKNISFIKMCPVPKWVISNSNKKNYLRQREKEHMKISNKFPSNSVV